MSAAFVQSWPGSRVLLGWWRELAGRKPQQLRLSRLHVHRVEALVLVRRPRPLDRWQRALLGLAGAHIPHSGELLKSLTDLQMDIQVLGQLVRELTEGGLLHRNGTGLWQMTPAGRRALETGAVSLAAEERRTFAFVDNSALGLPPHFLPLQLGPARFAEPASPETAGCSFEAASLEACIRQTSEWKACFHFPTDVEALLPPRPDDSPAANWRRVVLDAVEHRLFVFIHAAQTAGQASRLSSTAPRLLGFAVRPEGWTLEPEPLLALAEGWQEALPDLAAEPSLEMWRQAWQTWSHPRSLPQVEVTPCRLERADHRLLVHAPPRLIDRLRTARSDAIKHEAWLLAGDGRTRTAAQIELHPL
jgi:hypothetical protein